MANKKFSAAMLAIVLTLGLAVVGCSKDGTTNSKASGKSGYSGPLVGKWYNTQEDADKAGAADAAGKLYTMDEFTKLAQAEKIPNGAWYDYPMYEFKSNGKLSILGGTTEATYTATADTITIYSEPAHYTISGTELTITDPKGTGMTGLTPNTYYKPKK
jgi:hypothetical protein